jgi:hypothetical protein
MCIAPDPVLCALPLGGIAQVSSRLHSPGGGRSSDGRARKVAPASCGRLRKCDTPARRPIAQKSDVEVRRGAPPGSAGCVSAGKRSMMAQPNTPTHCPSAGAWKTECGVAHVGVIEVREAHRVMGVNALHINADKLESAFIWRK